MHQSRTIGGRADSTNVNPSASILPSRRIRRNYRPDFRCEVSVDACGAGAFLLVHERLQCALKTRIRLSGNFVRHCFREIERGATAVGVDQKPEVSMFVFLSAAFVATYSMKNDR